MPQLFSTSAVSRLPRKSIPVGLLPEYGIDYLQVEVVKIKNNVTFKINKSLKAVLKICT
jgi:hypothetical protein